MKQLGSSENIRLYLVVLFSVIILTFWNNFVGQKQQEQKVAQQQAQQQTAVKSSEESTTLTIEDKNKTEAKATSVDFNENSQNSSFFNRNLDLKNYKMLVKAKFIPSKEALLETSDFKADYSVELVESNLLEFKTSKIKTKNNKTVLGKDIYTFSFLKKNFNEILYLDEKGEVVKTQVSKIKKNHEFSLNGFFGISSNYFNFSFIKKEKSNMKIFVTENEEEVFLNLSIDQNATEGQECFDVFAGGKDINILKKYADMFSIPKFNRILDLGFFSIIAKPILIGMEKINKYINNYVISIILITLLLKIVTIPLINSSYKSTQKMKDISPKINQLKEVYKDDKVKLNQAIMGLYKEYKINPLSAMFPMLIQIPILFAFYKVLSNAFYLYGATGVFWIKDLSSPENLSFVNLFGLLPFEVPAFLKIGPMSLIMGATTFLQQKLSSAGNIDESQKSLMYIMPVFLTFISTSFPSGLLIYWIFSNIFGILHQYFYNNLLSKKGNR